VSRHDPERRRALYQHRKESGLCCDCGAGLQENDGLRCIECEARHRAWARSEKGRSVRARTARMIRERARREGRCIDCTAPAAPHRIRCEAHLAASREYARKWRHNKESQ
jgi:hypothetical protein